VKGLWSKVLLLIGLTLFTHRAVEAQTGVEYATPRNYEIGGIELAGSENLDKNVVVLLSGLQVGDRIDIPGTKITKAIEKLWDQKLFDEIAISIKERIGDDVVILEIYLKELPRLSKFSFTGVKKSRIDDLRDLIQLNRGKVVNDNLIVSTKNRLENYYIEKGYLNANIVIDSKPDPNEANGMILDIAIDKGSRVKIEEIIFHGNEQVESVKLRRTMKDTKQMGIARIFKSSKYLEDEYRDDLQKIVGYYNTLGYRDAYVVKDSLYKYTDATVRLEIWIDEGSQYYFRNISWLGNTKYTNAELSKVLDIEKGDVYDQGRLDGRLYGSVDGNDVTSMYMDQGHLFFDIRPVEIYAENDSIDIEMRIREGQPARINRVYVTGNTRTNDHVIMREIRTKPGQLFSRTDVMRTTRELANLGYFDPEQILPTPKPDPETGMVDIEYNVVERSTSQIELQGGWGAGRVVGTFGVTFDNFSTKQMFAENGWNPLPQGDGQRISLRAQSNGRFFQSYNASFTEPWLGGKKPNSLTVSFYHSVQNPTGRPKDDPLRQELSITGIGIGIGRRLKWPDDYFTLYTGVNLQRYNLFNYQNLFALGYTDGQSYNLNLKIILGRSSVDQPIYPRRGSNFAITAQITPPFSLLIDEDWGTVEPEVKYKFIEYHKWKIDASWYTRIIGDLVFKTQIQFGFLGQYNREWGYSPFERFYVGGDGLQGFVLDGREVIGLRGYPNNSVSPIGGGVIYDKFTAELRYPLTLNPNSTIYGLLFAEGGNAWGDFRQFKPFDIKRAMGFGVRIFMPMFGMLGVDFGYGYDPLGGPFGIPSGWQTHFILGQQF
jgi:outer membrane protein insertion porin family